MKPCLVRLFAAAALGIVTSTLLAGRAEAHGKQIDLDAYCKAVNYRGGVKLPTDPKWYARYNARQKRWECIRPRSYGFNTISAEVVKPLNLVDACQKKGGSPKVHYHEGTNVNAAGSVHCGVHDGTVAKHGTPAKLRLCNNSSHARIRAAYAYADRRPGLQGWTAAGWWTIARGQCQQVTVPDGPTGKPYSGAVYIYGENSKAAWRGQDARFCVQSGTAFTLTSAGKMPCQGGSLKKVGMYKAVVRPGINTWNFR